MLGSAAVNLLKQRLGRGTSASSAFESWIADEISAAQDRLELMPTLPEFLLSERAYIDITINEERVVLPSDFLRENEDDDMQVEDTDTGEFLELRKDQIDFMRIAYPDEETGAPKKYSKQGGYFRLRPIPNKSTYRLWMTYYKKADAFSVDAENGWLANYPDLLIAEAGVPLATTLKNQVALQMLSAMRTEQMTLLHNNETAKKMANFNPNPED